MKKLILASKSPRRREILSMLGLHIEILSLDTDEAGERNRLTPAELVTGLACRKVRAAWDALRDREDLDDCVVLSADTVVAYNGEILEKPSDAEDARRMLRMLSGKRHTVFTGVAVMHRGALALDVQKTDVYFRTISEEEIDDYVASGEPMDKAGAYAAQGRGSLFVSRIDGDYFNVVGLPAEKVDAMMKQTFGFGLRDMA